MIQVILTITLRGGAKFRTLEKDCKIREQIIPYHNETPSHTTIRNWVLKVGYYELTRPKDKADDWIIILDHSIQFGQEKIFTILGIRQKDFLKLNRPLQYTDLEALLENPMKTSNGELVLSEIERLQKELGNIIYAVGDYGSDLKKGLRLAFIPHIHDLSHAISLEIEKIFKKEIILMRNRFIQTNVAPVVPPKQRKKSEYQSFDKIVKWADKALHLVNNTLNDADKIKELREEFNNTTLDRIKENLIWIKNYKELITELSEINNAIKEIEKDMKYNGLSSITLKNAKISLQKLKSNKGIILKDNILRKLHEQFVLLPGTDNILCSSDIIESTFGKYKNRVSENPMASVTSLMLIMAAFTCSLTAEKVQECIENVKISDIKTWADDKIGVSLHKQRNLLFSI